MIKDQQIIGVADSQNNSEHKEDMNCEPMSPER